MKILKIISLILVIVLVFSGVYVYLNRVSLFKQSVDKLIEDLLPAYIKIKDINFDFKNHTISVEDFKIINPPGFKHEYLIEAPLIRCDYSQVDQANILKGLTLGNIKLIEPVLYIDRREDSRINVQEMDKIFSKKKITEKNPLMTKLNTLFSYILSPIKNIDQLLDIDPSFDINGGLFLFYDGLIEDGYITTIDNIRASVTLDLKKGYKGVDFVKTKGSGEINSFPNQHIDWDTGYDPTRGKLTMNNTFNIRDLDFIHFAPYYDKFSPFLFTKGRASGELVLNFDNGDIGSTNELRLSNLTFTQNKERSFNQYWPTGGEDLYKYFLSAGGEVVFDFKIKGTMENPKFYLGSKTKRALARMVFSKITEQIFKKDEESSTKGDGSSTPDEDKSDLEKVIDIFKSF